MNMCTCATLAGQLLSHPIARYDSSLEVQHGSKRAA